MSYQIIIATTNTILDCAADRNILLTPLKLQKLLYINYGRELASGQDTKPYMNFEAWTYGPVLPTIYHQYKGLGSNNIRNKLTNDEGEVLELVDKDCVNDTIRRFGNWTGAELVDFVHRQDGAWWKAFAQGSSTLIDHEDIRNDFAR